MRLAILLLLCTVVRARIIECDPTAVLNICLGSEKKQGDYCSFCDLKNQQISESDEVIFILHPSDDLEVVSFTGGEVTKLPNIIRKADNKEFLKVLLSRTKTRVLNSQFFGNASENLNHFGSKSNNKLSVEAFAFQNCTNLEHLDLSDNKGLSIISPDAFRGLDNLVELNLGRNELSLVLADWFEDLGNLEGLNLNYNRLAEIPDRAFKSLTKLQWLILDQNYIEIITKTMFKHNDKLQAIIFSRNRINQIQLESFAHLSQLNYLDLGENSCVDSKFINKTSEEIGKRLSACYVRSACVIPQIKNGFIVTIDYNSTRFPGDLFEDSGKVKVVCNSTFTQIHDKANQTTNRCVKEDWGDPQWPTCQSESFYFSSFIFK